MHKSVVNFRPGANEKVRGSLQKESRGDGLFDDAAVEEKNTAVAFPRFNTF